MQNVVNGRYTQLHTLISYELLIAVTTSAIHQLLGQKKYMFMLLNIQISFSSMQLSHVVLHNAVHAPSNCQYGLLKHKYNHDSNHVK